MKRWGLDKIHMNCSRHWRYLPLWKDSSEFWLPFTLSSPLIRLWLVPAFYVIFPYDKIHPYELIFAFFISFSPDHLPFLTAIVPITKPQTWHYLLCRRRILYKDARNWLHTPSLHTPSLVASMQSECSASTGWFLCKRDIVSLLGPPTNDTIPHPNFTF